MSPGSGVVEELVSDTPMVLEEVVVDSPVQENATIAAPAADVVEELVSITLTPEATSTHLQGAAEEQTSSASHPVATVELVSPALSNMDLAEHLVTKRNIVDDHAGKLVVLSLCQRTEPRDNRAGGGPEGEGQDKGQDHGAQARAPAAGHGKALAKRGGGEGSHPTGESNSTGATAADPERTH